MGQLSDVAEIVMGQSPKGDACSNSPAGLPLLNGPTEFGSHHPLPTQWTTDPKRYAQPDDLLFCVRGSTTGRMNWADQDYAIGRGIAALRHKGGAQYQPWLRGVIEYQLDDLLVAATGSTFPNVSKDQLHCLEVPEHEEWEQREIAAILGALDDKIEVNRKTAATLEEMARALYRSWFVDFDPVHAKAAGRAAAHMDAATAALFPDSFGEDGLPEGWTEEPIIAQSDWVNGAAYKKMHFAKTPDALPVVKIAELKAGVTGNTKFTATDLGEKFRIGRGDLLFSWSGNPDTSIDAFIWALKDAWLNQHIFAVRPNGKMSKAALFTILKFYMPEFAEIARNKQTTGLGHITRKDLDAFSVRIAPPEIMEVFENEIEPMFDRYCLTLYENQTLATLRDTLLPRLMSGELRVGETREDIEEFS
ncbi:restriction endonuclease subunit S [Celeribacter arenosi]|uniref:Restriction endonuclease subunit S n=1 Tax=Celeribacter arenosi TaxID=792649 RepID=A0ABP7KG41_9RHOB